MPGPETAAELLMRKEREGAQRVPSRVSSVLCELYEPGELAEVFAALESVHRKRLARCVFAQERRKGKTYETARADAAEAAGRSESWVRDLVSGGTA